VTEAPSAVHSVLSGAGRRANVAGLGLIGGSIAAALTERGWCVSGDDLLDQRVQRAIAMGVIAAAGTDPGAEITFVATPVSALADRVARALAETSGVVTDVGSVKTGVTTSTTDPRFIGGHPMAGSELEGLDGADGSMFEGAVWVLTPTGDTDDTTFSAVAAIVADLGADVVALPPERHDQVVAVISHVPHLAAATLMGLASDRAEEHAALLRLAAGGFRDMTRIASGHPAIWLDICAENRPAIVSALDGLIDGLQEMRGFVSNNDRPQLLDRLQHAREARANLPTRGTQPGELSEMRIPIPDRPGAAAQIFTLAAELGVNVDSFEVVHSLEGNRGVAVVLVDAAVADLYRGGLMARGYRPSVHRLG
jgi:prephenate dehydrogenase